MVVVSGAKQYVKRRVLQYVVKKSKPTIQRYLTQEYGQFIGGAAGIAISVGIGDYYGAISGITGSSGPGTPKRGDPPFGYFPGEGLNGKTNSSFNQTLRAAQLSNRRIRRRPNRDNDCCCVTRRHRRSKRSRRR